MKIRLAAALLVCVLLSGCGNVFDGHYSSVTPHEQQSSQAEDQTVAAANYGQLYAALETLVEDGKAEGVISVADYPADTVAQDMGRAAEEVLRQNPIAAYAVADIRYELGKSGGKAALALEISYNYGAAELQKIRDAAGMDEAAELVLEALAQCEANLVLRIMDYEQRDFVQTVESYALEYPQFVMEQPQVSVAVYPETGTDRVVALRFTYQTSRESLRSMKAQVEPVFESALLYVSGNGEEKEKYSQLYSFLTERYDYQLAGSITPAYSLLRHGVGDSRAFAAVYAAMCRQAGLECLVVSGTYNAESRYWNIICDDGVYYHVDLLEESFRERTDRQMAGFVWDYSAYPACGVEPEGAEE